jgi:hypothetical protein
VSLLGGLGGVRVSTDDLFSRLYSSDDRRDYGDGDKQFSGRHFVTRAECTWEDGDIVPTLVNSLTLRRLFSSDDRFSWRV